MLIKFNNRFIVDSILDCLTRSAAVAEIADRTALFGIAVVSVTDDQGYLRRGYFGGRQFEGIG